jgi:hypothetical protein
VGNLRRMLAFGNIGPEGQNMQRYPLLTISCFAALIGSGAAADEACFEQVANTPGVTEMWLYAWMTTSHPTMPDTSWSLRS